MKRFFIIVLALFFISNVHAEGWKDSLNVKVYGYVKLDAFYDTRETVNVREGHFLLFPTPPNYDNEGIDKAAHGSFNMLAVQSNFGVSVTGANILNAKTMAKIEGDFFGQRNDNINLLRLRHAFFKLQWTNTNLIVGQYWSPMFNLEAFPGTVSFTTGTPILPFARNPQIRVTHRIKNLSLVAAVLSQRSFSSFGINPTNSTETISSSQFLRNSKLPEFHTKIMYAYQANHWFFKTGIGVGYKRIMPRTSTETNYATRKTISGTTVTSYINVKYRNFNVKCGGSYGNNATDLMSIGGFAVKAITDSVKNYYEYTTLSSYSVWAEINQQIKQFNLSVFSGYTEHLGAKEKITGQTWGFANNIAYIYRIAPRLTWQVKNLRLAFEIEHTVAGFGTPDEMGIPQNPINVSNTRFLLGAYYFFN